MRRGSKNLNNLRHARSLKRTALYGDVLISVIWLFAQQPSYADTYVIKCEFLSVETPRTFVDVLFEIDSNDENHTKVITDNNKFIANSFHNNENIYIAEMRENYGATTIMSLHDPNKIVAVRSLLSIVGVGGAENKTFSFNGHCRKSTR